LAEIKTTTSSTSFPRDIVDEAQQYVLKAFNEKAGNQLLYHTYQRSAHLVELVEQIAAGSNSEVIETAKLAAWFQATGCLEEYKNYESKSVNQARAFLQSRRYPESKMNQVLSAILNSRRDGRPMGKVDEILSDALTAHDYTNGFLENNPLMRLEQELVLNERVETSKWERNQLNELLNSKFYTPYGKINFEPALAKNILTQKKIAEKGRSSALQNVDDDDDKLRKYQSIEKKIPRSGIQSFFRSSYRSHIHLSMIADNKANIMISVNAILISILISVLTYQEVTTLTPQILLPVVTFLVTGLTSLIFAILAVRPNVTELNTAKTPKSDLPKNIIFFGNFVHLELDEYEEAMDTMFRDGELLYGNMTRDLYYLGKVLDKKYRYLTNSYNIFMVGFVATVLIFFFFLFIQL